VSRWGGREARRHSRCPERVSDTCARGVLVRDARGSSRRLWRAQRSLSAVAARGFTPVSRRTATARARQRRLRWRSRPRSRPRCRPGVWRAQRSLSSVAARGFTPSAAVGEGKGGAERATFPEDADANKNRGPACRTPGATPRQPLRSLQTKQPAGSRSLAALNEQPTCQCCRATRPAQISDLQRRAAAPRHHVTKLVRE
jgi:hypothetical protein